MGSINLSDADDQYDPSKAAGNPTVPDGTYEVEIVGTNLEGGTGPKGPWQKVALTCKVLSGPNAGGRFVDKVQILVGGGGAWRGQQGQAKIKEIGRLNGRTITDDAQLRGCRLTAVVITQTDEYTGKDGQLRRSTNNVITEITPVGSNVVDGSSSVAPEDIPF